MPTRFPSGIDQRLRPIARIDRGIGLDEILEGVISELDSGRVQKNDAHRYGLPHAERVAYRDHHIAPRAERRCHRR